MSTHEAASRFIRKAGDRFLANQVRLHRGVQNREIDVLFLLEDEIGVALLQEPFGLLADQDAAFDSLLLQLLGDEHVVAENVVTSNVRADDASDEITLV